MHRILHLSDTAVSAGAPGPDPATAALEALLHDARFLRDIDLVVVSGDVSADQTTTSYAAVRRMVGDVAATHDALHVYAVGDRDDQGRFSEVLGSGHLGADGLDVGGSGPDGQRRGWVSHVGGLRVVTLDTSVPGASHGQLGESQAQWLAQALASPAPDGTVLVLHHPPLSPDSHRHLAARALRDADRLAEAVRGSDVQVVLAGHLGVELHGMLGGVPVLVAPGVDARTDLTSPTHLDRTVRGAGACVVELGGAYSPLSYAVWSRDQRAGEELSLRDGASGHPLAKEDSLEQVSAPGAAFALSERIPQGEAPAAAAGIPEDGWPRELDSSTRSVSAPPPAVTERTDPVWLDDADAPAPLRDLEPLVVELPPRDDADRAQWLPDLTEPATASVADESEPDDDEPGDGEPADENGGDAPESPVEDSGVLSWAFSAREERPQDA